MKLLKNYWDSFFIGDGSFSYGDRFFLRKILLTSHAFNYQRRFNMITGLIILFIVFVVFILFRTFVLSMKEDNNYVMIVCLAVLVGIANIFYLWLKTKK